MSQHMSRRSMLGLAAGSALSVVVSQSLLGCAADAVTESSRTSSDSTGTTTSTSCVLTAALTEGPYFVDEKLYRSDIRTDPVTGDISDGVLLQLAFNVARVASGACTPLTGAYLDVRSEEHTSELQSRLHLVCRLLLEKKKRHSHTEVEN